MNKLSLQTKTGFRTKNHFEIYDVNGNLFYSSDFTNKIANGETLYFNLPLGDYTFNGQLEKLQTPVKYRKIDLPYPERFIPRGDYDIQFGDNPNKCTIYYDEELILFDNMFKSAPLYIIAGIYLHEMGHHYYESEELADLYMVKMMLKEGYNPSQIGYLPLMSLTHNDYTSQQRIKKIVNRILKV